MELIPGAVSPVGLGLDTKKDPPKQVFFRMLGGKIRPLLGAAPSPSAPLRRTIDTV